MALLDHISNELCKYFNNKVATSDSGILVVTHDGNYQRDELTAIWILRMIYGDNMKYERTRDEETISNADIVVDVGGQFDARLARFDHHQKDFNITHADLVPGGYNTKLSSAGLVWVYFGKECVRMYKRDASDEDIDAVWRKIYSDVIREIDMIDNGVDVTTRTLDDGNLNVTTWSDMTKLRAHTFISLDDGFFYELQETHNYMRLWLDYCFYMLEKRKALRDSIEKNVDKVGNIRYTEIPNSAQEWEEAIYEYEDDGNESIEFIIVQQKVDKWKIECVPIRGVKFSKRIPFLEKWAGLMGEEFATVCGVDDAIFCHKNRFCAIAKSREGAIKLIRNNCYTPTTEEPEWSKTPVKGELILLEEFLIAATE